jgi:hypothetical protein
VLSAVIGVFLTAVTVWLFTALLTGRRTGAMRKRV